MNMDHLRFLQEAANHDVHIVEAKEGTYKGSWKKRDGASVFHMVARMWDRTETITEEGKKTIFDIIRAENYSMDDGKLRAILADLRRYLLLIEAQMLSEIDSDPRQDEDKLGPIGRRLKGDERYLDPLAARKRMDEVEVTVSTEHLKEPELRITARQQAYLDKWEDDKRREVEIMLGEQDAKHEVEKLAMENFASGPQWTQEQLDSIARQVALLEPRVRATPEVDEEPINTEAQNDVVVPGSVVPPNTNWLIRDKIPMIYVNFFVNTETGGKYCLRRSVPASDYQNMPHDMQSLYVNVQDAFHLKTKYVEEQNRQLNK